jgi:hypothetical protein
VTENTLSANAPKVNPYSGLDEDEVYTYLGYEYPDLSDKNRRQFAQIWARGWCDRRPLDEMIEDRRWGKGGVQLTDDEKFDAVDRDLGRYWFGRAGDGTIATDIVDESYLCDWHELRIRFQHLDRFRRPVRNPRPDFFYPPGSFERAEAWWLERELKWTREWRTAELWVELYTLKHQEAANVVH